MKEDGGVHSEDRASRPASLKECYLRVENAKSPDAIIHMGMNQCGTAKQAGRQGADGGSGGSTGSNIIPPATG